MPFIDSQRMLTQKICCRSAAVAAVTDGLQQTSSAFALSLLLATFALVRVTYCRFVCVTGVRRKQNKQTVAQASIHLLGAYIRVGLLSRRYPAALLLRSTANSLV